MSEVQSRSARGRVSARGGRGGFSSRGGRGGNSRSAADNSDLSSFEEGEIGEMKKKYSDTLPTLKELFPDWKDEDLVFALEDSNGELEEAIERITEGNVSQWGEVKKKTAADRTKPKAKEVQSTPTESIAASARGARGRGGFEGRGRARGDRGRGGRGGRATTHTNGTRAAAGTTETPVAAAVPEPVTTQAPEEVESVPTAGAESESAEPKASVIPEGTKKGWAAPALVSQKPAEPTTEQKAPEAVPAPAAPQKTPVAKPTEPVAPVIPQATAKPPAADDLTEINLEQIPDVSAPAPTATAASTVGSAFDPAAAANATPSRVASSGLPGSALKQGTRAPGFQRRVMEQQQAVVMPGNHAVDRAAVQFGSMGLNGDAVDIDENREQAETRAQPPQHSPVAPRASLPPSHQGVSETGAARPAPGLPPVPQASAAESFTDFARYGEPQKPFDPFTQQVSQPQQQIQEPFANQTPAQPTATTSGDFSPFYAADQQRFPYYNYGNYGQSQDAGAGPRAAGRYGPVDANNSGQNTPNPTLPGATATPAAQHMPGQSQHAYGYGGYPYYSNPPMNQHNYGRNRGMYDDARRYDQEQQQQQQQQQQQHYGMPHASQYGYGGQQYGPYGGKGGMYGQPQGFYDHSAPANAGSFNQGAMPGRDSVYGRTGSAQPSESQQSATGTATFSSGMSDVFGRSQTETKGFEASKTGGPSPSLAQNRPGSASNSIPGQPQAQTGLPPLQGQQGQQSFGAYPQLNPQYGGLGGLGNHQGAASQTHQASGYGGYGAGFSNYYGGNTRGGWGNNYTH
ncbi:hypothetical protein N7526_002289 [Penicillium atrosanguineum]|nr:hypothetical protein N7526_002289 [Penicillium atrosanguineum]